MAQSEQYNEPHSMNDSVRRSSEQMPELLSASRQQKFDLLTNLVRTQRQPLILCGPEGVGKTTMLTLLAKTNIQKYLWNYIECDSALTLDTLINHLSTVLAVQSGSSLSKQRDSKAEPLIAQLERIANSGQTVVLILDDAGKLGAGIFSELFDFVKTCKSLRIVVTITPNHLFIKRATDPNIDECYLVEIPLLNESQAESFTFMHLKENRELLAFESISQDIASEIYHKSHGIPGLMLQELAGMESKSSRIFDNSKYSALKLLGMLLLLGVAVWLGFRLIGTDNEQGSQVRHIELTPLPKHVEQRTEPQNTVDPMVNTTSELSLSTINPESTQQASTLLSDDSMIASTQEVVNTTLERGISSLIENQAETVEPNQIAQAETSKTVDRSTLFPAKKTTPISKKSKILITTIHDPDWVLKQSRLAFTLQLSAFPSSAGIQRFLNDFPEIEQNAAYYTMARQGRTWYGLIYGIYPTVQHARLAANSLPPGIGKPYMQSLNKIHSRIKSSR